MTVRRGGPPPGGLLALIRGIKPFCSLAVAIAAAVGAKLLFPRASFGLTEAAYFFLAPWYIAMIFLHRDAVFGKTWQTRLSVAILGGALVGAFLYFADFLFRAAVFGDLRLAWSPAPPNLVILGCASAIVETVVLQLGIQIRIGGWTGVIVAALAFIVVHLSVNPIFFIAGFALALTQRYTGLPGTVIVAHFVYNALISSFPPP